MSGGSTTKRERIIPIQIEESSNDSTPENSQSYAQAARRGKKQPSRPECLDSSTDQDLYEDVDMNDSDAPKNSRSLPLCNSKEKIIIVIDCAEDEKVTSFKLNNKSQKPLFMIKRAAELFISLKYLISQQDEYALVVLNENSAIWLLNFTNNIREVINTLQNISGCETEDIFDLNSLFEVIVKNVDVPEENDMNNLLVTPQYVVRTILFYGRSYTLPKVQKNEEIEKLLKSPYFTVDVLMTHEPVDVDNNCNKIFNVLQSLDAKGFAYFFPVGRDSKTLQESVGKLLAHPLQRPIQKLANYSLKKYQV